MPIPAGHKTNFETLKRAITNNDLALLWCWDVKEERFTAVICAVNRPDDADPDYRMTPVAQMLGEENPYDRFIPPSHPDYPEDKDVTETVSADGGSVGGSSGELAGSPE